MTVGLVGVAIASATAGALVAATLASTPLLQSQLSPEDADAFDQDGISTGETFRLPRLTRPVNILVLGIKVLSSDVENPPPELRNLGYHALVNSFDGLSDTMMLIRFDPSNGTVTVLSLPRDTRTFVEGVGVTKLNDANAYGGPALAARSVSYLLGDIRIDRYVRINVQGVEKLIDALGGVTVYVPQDMRYQDDSQHLYINLKEGEQHLNGEQAMQFLRFRYDQYGDIGRVQRQQAFMGALIEQTLSPATLARMPRILSVIQENIDTNLTVEETVALVGFATRTNRSEVQMLMLPGDFSLESEFDLSYWLPNYAGIDALVDQYFRSDGARSVDYRPDPSRVRIAIQDSTGRSRSAGRLLDALYDAGYSNAYLDRRWNESLDTTRIIAQRGDLESAEALRRILGVGDVRVESTGVLQSDITIRLGTDWVDRDRL
jgi:LCP family protein required for cell wall assembly